MHIINYCPLTREGLHIENHQPCPCVFPLYLVSRSLAYLTLIMFSFIHPKRAVRFVKALWEQFSLLAIRLIHSRDESHQNVNYVITPARRLKMLNAVKAGVHEPEMFEMVNVVRKKDNDIRTTMKKGIFLLWPK